ncbi:hypothetical protein R1flu_011921 [Riccia fluitans]|uniref:WRC domain-containing protein n=1 Tax=Riccia fluitans TaxID=41844 RepID=A0ABD1ZAB4_9MARC
MRIRKSRMSSRFTPEFCEAHGIVYGPALDSTRRIISEFNRQPPESTETRIAKPLMLDATKEVHNDAGTSHTSEETESAPIRIRDFVLAPHVRSTAGKKFQYCARTHQSTASVSDAGRATDSSERTATQHSNGTRSKVPTEKVNSDASSRPVGKRKLEQQKKAPPVQHVEPETPRNPQVPKQFTSNKSVTGSGQITGSRKRPRSKIMEPDSRTAQDKGTARPRSDYECRAREPATCTDTDMVLSSGTPMRELDVVFSTGAAGRRPEVEERRQGNESKEKTPGASNFPEGWSYRGLAQIAEQDKPPQGKQCGRTDGRSWRCPLKVQEGYTLCEHHLSKFRIKKISKENKRKRYIEWKRKRQLELEQQEEKEKGEQDVEQDEDEQKRLEPPTPDSVPDQTPATGEHDVPMRFRRKQKKTVKLSVL